MKLFDNHELYINTNEFGSTNSFRKATNNLNLNCFDFETADWNKNQQIKEEKNCLNQTNAKYQFKNDAPHAHMRC